MGSNSEVGYGKNGENLYELKSRTATFDPPYNPQRVLLTQAALDDLYTRTMDAINEVLTKVTAEDTVVNNRRIKFDGVGPLATRVVNIVRSSGTDKRNVEDAEGFLRLIRGERASKPKASPDPAAPPPTQHSPSRTSMDNIIQHMSGLASLIKNDPLYLTADPDLTNAAIAAYIADLISLNQAADVAIAQTGQARIVRNHIIDNDVDGVVYVAENVKLFTKGTYGATSPQYKSISKIKFRKGTR